MANKIPIVDYNGKQSEMLATDTIPVSNLGTGTPTGTKFLRDDGTFAVPAGSGGGSLTVTEIEIDFGSTPTSGKRFTITDASVNTSSKILVSPSGNPATGRGKDDWEWDSIQFAPKPETGTFTLYAKASGRIMGKRKIFYSIN